MATGFELLLLAAVVAALFGVHRVIKTVKPLVVNAVVGLVVLLVANALGFGVAVTPVVVLIVALAGLPGAILVILLAQLGLLFQPLVLLPL
ncbi:MAG: pro-sigmaK processing inhibitor BofA family protein [Halobacteriales archaeon]|nr:pro-sigmaK processing inhibitor BofA family protein [Halobacteriales archaeon]